MERITVLVVEDNPLNMKLVRALLSKGPYDIQEAGDGETALQLAASLQPGLILMDIQLPGMDGLTATRLIRANEKLAKTPIVALTSYAMEGDREKALEAGCNGYISKPIDTRNFLGAISEVLKDALRGK
jgi:CheY-like chemotaxis protein